MRQFRAWRSRALGDVEDDDLLLPQSRVLLRAVERRPWSLDARAPPAKEPSASRPPPRHPHLNGDPHQVPSSARATLRPPPHSSAARAFQPPHARSRGEELPATSLSSVGDKPPPELPELARLLAGSCCRREWIHQCQLRRLPPFLGLGGAYARLLGSCGVDAGGKWRRTTAHAQRWRRGMDKPPWCPVEEGLLCKNETFS